MSSLLDNHQAREGSRAAQGDQPGSLHQGGIQLRSWRGTLGMLYLRSREASRDPLALLKDLQLARFSRWSGQKGGHKPLLWLWPPPCSTQLFQASRGSGL